jgi:hypothetical protein
VELVGLVVLVAAGVETAGLDTEELVSFEPQPASATITAVSASKENIGKPWADACLAVESLTACSSVGWGRLTL